MADNERKDYDDPRLPEIRSLITSSGGDPKSFQGELITQLIQTSLRLIAEEHDNGQLKLMNRALKEMRYAYNIFNRHPGERRVSIFGSARTPEDHPDYIAARKFATDISRYGWRCMTGAANGIMKAGLEGPHPETTFGLSIRLPMESTINSVIEGNPKLITFRYFFTRKLMFMGHSDAAAVFPGGFGTLDELFEFLTLMQTGKTNIIPIVLLEGLKGDYWKSWEEYLTKNLLKNGWISSWDVNFYYRAESIKDAIDHIQKFYSRYHSSRYVKDFFVIRMRTPLTSEQIEILNQKYSTLVKAGKIYQDGPFPEETDHLDLPRVIFEHTHKAYGLLRQMIDQINNF